jgi:hypothetical protein
LQREAALQQLRVVLPALGNSELLVRVLALEAL